MLKFVRAVLYTAAAAFTVFAVWIFQFAVRINIYALSESFKGEIIAFSQPIDTAFYVFCLAVTICFAAITAKLLVNFYKDVATIR